MPDVRSKYILGIGSQRCGTTYLHHLLSASPDVFMHPVKELHYFDLRCSPEHLTRRNYSVEASRRRLARKKPWSGITFRSKLWFKTHALIAEKHPTEYKYETLFDGAYGKYQYVGEVTPDYMTLASDSLEDMRAVIGADAKIIFLQRDRLERLVSAFKLWANGNLEQKVHYSNEHLDSLFIELVTKNRAWIANQTKLNDYDGTLRRYGNVFDSILVLNYKELSNVSGTIERLEQFLNIRIPEWKVRILETKKRNSFYEQYSPSEEVVSMVNDTFGLLELQANESQ